MLVDRREKENGDRILLPELGLKRLSVLAPRKAFHLWILATGIRAALALTAFASLLLICVCRTKLQSKATVPLRFLSPFH